LSSRKIAKAASAANGRAKDRHIEAGLSDVLSEFARAMATDFPIQGILDHLVAQIVDILPITGAGVTLISPSSEPRYVAASSPHAMRFEQLQTELAEGTCLPSYHTGESVSVPDLRSDHRFGTFCPSVLAAGLAAGFAFPLRHGQSRLGALDLYRNAAGPLPPDPTSAAQTLACRGRLVLFRAQAPTRTPTECRRGVSPIS